MIMVSLPSVSPRPFCTDADTLPTGIPNISPAVIDTIRKAKKGFTLAQVTSTTSKIIQNRIEIRAIIIVSFFAAQLK
jgi:hypothetical protein